MNFKLQLQISTSVFYLNLKLQFQTIFSNLNFKLKSTIFNFQLWAPSSDWTWPNTAPACYHIIIWYMKSASNFSTPTLTFMFLLSTQLQISNFMLWLAHLSLSLFPYVIFEMGISLETCLRALIIWLCSDIWHFYEIIRINVR